MNRKLSRRSSPPPLPLTRPLKKIKTNNNLTSESRQGIYKGHAQDLFLFLHKLEIYLMELFPHLAFREFFRPKSINLIIFLVHYHQHFHFQRVGEIV